MEFHTETLDDLRDAIGRARPGDTIHHSGTTDLEGIDVPKGVTAYLAGGQIRLRGCSGLTMTGNVINGD